MKQKELRHDEDEVTKRSGITAKYENIYYFFDFDHVDIEWSRGRIIIGLAGPILK